MTQDSEERRLDALERAAGVTEDRRLVFRIVYDDAPEPIGYTEDARPPFVTSYPVYAAGLDRYGGVVDVHIGGICEGDI